MGIAKRAEVDGMVVFQSLEGHTIDALRLYKAYVDANGKTIGAFCKRWGLDKSQFMKNTFEVILFHDIGKLTKEFQTSIKMGKSSQDFPHPLTSLYILLMIIANGSDVLRPLVPRLCLLSGESIPELCAVLAHHTQLYSGLYDGITADAEILFDEANDFIGRADSIRKTFGFEGWRYDFSPIKQLDIKFFQYFKIIKSELIDFCQNELSDKERIKLKAIYAYIYSILQICDDYASANFEAYVKEERHIDDGSILGPVMDVEDARKYVIPYPDVTTEDILNGRKPYEFQERLKGIGSFAMLLAPCGRGKTEGALMWAESMRYRCYTNRLIFAMPTQITSNAMAKRLSKIYGEGNVGVYHGKSLIYHTDLIKESVETEEEKYFEMAHEANFMSKVMLKPIMVTTVDHLAFSFIHGFSQSDFALGDVQNACIIFDEVHYYEKLTLSHLTRLFSLLRHMGIPHLLMSGTFPEFIKTYLDKEASNEGNKYDFIADEEGLKYKPFIIKKEEVCTVYRDENKDYVVEQSLKEAIIRNHEKDMRQFIVVNTIRRAQEIYKSLGLPEGDTVLYHSRYTGHDRAKKDDMVLKSNARRPFVLISTQAIEISLDISCDIMYTELAPADALGQRGGRLNRGAKTYKTKYGDALMYVYEAEDTLPYATQKEEDIIAVLNRTRQNMADMPYSYNTIKALCDKAYDGFKLGISDFPAFFHKAVLFGYSYKDITQNGAGEEGKVFKFRNDNYLAIDAYPDDVVNGDIEKCYDFENIVKVPYWWFATDRQMDRFYVIEGIKRKYLICKLPYSYELGFDESKINEVLTNGGIFI